MGLRIKSLVFSILLSIGFSIFIVKHPPENILSWDNYGHYLYLPATFIYDDPYLSDLEPFLELNEKYHNLSTLYVVYDAENGNHFIKYPMGYSVLMSPFFAAGHWFCSFTDYPRDGFSKPYQYAVIVGCWFYFMLGLIFLERLLSALFKERIAITLLILLVFGTNLSYYGIYGIGMIHGVAFGFYAMLLFFTMKWYQRPTLFNSIMLAVTFGLLSLSRASEVIAVLIPLFWGMKKFNWGELRQRINLFKERKITVAVMTIIVVLIGSMQMIYWKLCTDSWIIDSYNNPGEGFDFFPPHLLDYLFSFRKGWLLYTPIMVFSILGFYAIRRSYKDYTILIIFGILNLLLLSAWTCWWYAESFSQRSIVQSYPVYIVSLGFFIQYVRQKKWASYLIGSLLVIFVGLNLFQTWQFTQTIIHPSRMTAKAYWSVFLKTERPEMFENYLIVDDRQDAQACIEDTNRFEVETYLKIDFEQDVPEGVSLSASIDERCIEINDDRIYTEMVAIPYHEFSDLQYSIFNVRARFLVNGNPEEVKAALAFRIAHGEMYFQKYLVPHEITEVTSGEWITCSMSFFAPYVRSSSDHVEIFGWLMGSGQAYIDDIEVTTFRRIVDYN